MREFVHVLERDAKANQHLIKCTLLRVDAMDIFEPANPPFAIVLREYRVFVVSNANCSPHMLLGLHVITSASSVYGFRLNQYRFVRIRRALVRPLE